MGASRAGFNVEAAVELDPHAISTHAVNFPNSIHLEEDVSKLTAEYILGKISSSSIDAVIGGPPCQGFSSIGKGLPEDNRNQLYMHFYRLVSEIKPKLFLAENVPGIMQDKFIKIREAAFSLVDKDYYLLPPVSIRASDFGAPTTRTRIFFVGYRKDYGTGFINSDIFSPPISEPIKVENALWGLPEYVDENWQSEEQGWQFIRKDRDGIFYEKLWGHVPNGVGDPESMLRLEQNVVSGFLGTVHSTQVRDRYQSLMYGETDKISRSTRLNPLGFCPTLRAGTASDKGSFQAVRPIHPTQPRVITPREAARLQGFPDWFKFHRTKWHSFRQIGNSVSPIVAEYILKKLYDAFSRDIVQERNSHHDSLKIRI